MKQLRRFTWILLNQNAQMTEVNGPTIRLRMSNNGSIDTFARGGSEDVPREALSVVTGREFEIEVGGGVQPVIHREGGENSTSDTTS